MCSNQSSSPQTIRNPDKYFQCVFVYIRQNVYTMCYSSLNNNFNILLIVSTIKHVFALIIFSHHHYESYFSLYIYNISLIEHIQPLRSHTARNFRWYTNSDMLSIFPPFTKFRSTRQTYIHCSP